MGCRHSTCRKLKMILAYPYLSCDTQWYHVCPQGNSQKWLSLIENFVSLRDRFISTCWGFYGYALLRGGKIQAFHLEFTAITTFKYKRQSPFHSTIITYSCTNIPPTCTVSNVNEGLVGKWALLKAEHSQPFIVSNRPKQGIKLGLKLLILATYDPNGDQMKVAFHQ